MKTNFHRSTVAIFAYNRLDSLQCLWESLLNCEDFEGRSLVIFHDGLKANTSEINQKKWQIVRDWLATLSDHPKLEIRFSDSNRGLAKSIFSGVSEILSREETIIVLEDDLVLARSFLSFMDEALHTYRDAENIFSISGYSHFCEPDLNGTETGVFLYPRPNSWGWATWAKKWKGFHLNNYDKTDLQNYKALKKFQNGGLDLPWMLRNQLLGKIDSWAIQWSWYQFKNNGFSVYPVCSKVQNIGFGEDATHTSSLKGAQGEICENKLKLPLELALDEEVVVRYRKYFKLGLLTRFRNLWFMTGLRLRNMN